MFLLWKTRTLVKIIKYLLIIRKKECKERRKFIFKKIQKGEIDKDHYKEHIVPKKISRKRSISRIRSSKFVDESRNRISTRRRIENLSRSCSRGRYRVKRSRSSSKSDSFSFNYSIPSDCSECKRILKEKSDCNKYEMN